jgi:AraC family transcriptional regulator, transcriptional activator of pobA
MEIARLDNKKHHFTIPDDYQILWIRDGIREINIDLETIPFYKNLVIFLTPGRVVKLKFSRQAPQGWVMGFSRDFFKGRNPDGLHHINNIDIFFSHSEVPRIVLSPKIGDRVNVIAEMISELCLSQISNREAAVSYLLSTLLVYCNSERHIWSNYGHNHNDLNIVSLFNQLVSEHFMEIHQVSEYAAMLNITPKYLSQVVKRVTGVTAKNNIQERLKIQACRDLKFSNDTVKEIAYKLGFSESENFSHFFKKTTGQTPTGFRGIY